MNDVCRFNQCYGVLGVLDRFHGTDSLFRSSKAYNRHVMMLSLVPAREAFPEHELEPSSDSQSFPDAAKTLCRH